MIIQVIADIINGLNQTCVSQYKPNQPALFSNQRLENMQDTALMTKPVQDITNLYVFLMTLHNLLRCYTTWASPPLEHSLTKSKYSKA